MPFEVRTGEGEHVASIIADRRLYVTADRSRVVEDGDPKAAFLLAGDGSEIPTAEAARLGLSVADGRVVYAAVTAPAPAEPEAKPKGRSKKSGG